MKLDVRHLTPCTQDLRETAPDLEISCFPFQTEAIIKSLKKPNGTDGQNVKQGNKLGFLTMFRTKLSPGHHKPEGNNILGNF